MQENTIRTRAYNLYQLDWMQRHDCSIMDIIYGMSDVIQGNDVVDAFYTWESDIGFQGSCYASYEEFLECEYLEEDYIKELFDVTPNGPYLYGQYLADINEIRQEKKEREDIEEEKDESR